MRSSKRKSVGGGFSQEYVAPGGGVRGSNSRWAGGRRSEGLTSKGTPGTRCSQYRGSRGEEQPLILKK